MQGTYFFRSGFSRSSSRSFASAAPVIARITGVSAASGVPPLSSIGGVALKSAFVSRPGIAMRSGFSMRSGFFRSANSRKGLTKGAMLADILLVVAWGATIPGLMWLGAVSGF